MDKDTLFQKAMWSSIPGRMMDLFKTNYVYRSKRGEKLKTHHKGKEYIRGFVPDEFYPEEGASFKMFHHRVGKVQKFGQIQLDGCKNIVIEDDMLYFENGEGSGKYILMPCQQN